MLPLPKYVVEWCWQNPVPVCRINNSVVSAASCRQPVAAQPAQNEFSYLCLRRFQLVSFSLIIYLLVNIC